MSFIAAADGAKLYVKDWGQGRPLVLIHGWPLSADMWEYQMPALVEAGFRVVAYDRRGFGRSDQPWSGYNYDTLADDLKAVMQTLGLDGATLVGFSMGGGEIARYMSRHGGAGVARTVLVSSVVPKMLKAPDNPDGVDRGVLDNMIAQLQADRPKFLAEFSKTFFGVGLLTSPVSSELIQWAGNLALQASPRATTECVHAFGETDFRADLPHFRVPTLIIHGDKDQTVPIKPTSEAAAKAIPGARLVVYDGAPHATPFAEKDRLTRDLIAFHSG